MSGGARRLRATFWLLDAPDSLARQSRREPDGTGVGWFDADDRPQLAKQPLAAYADRAFADQARELESPIFVAHVRYATTGAVEARNTHPFEQRDQSVVGTRMRPSSSNGKPSITGPPAAGPSRR